MCYRTVTVTISVKKKTVYTPARTTRSNNNILLGVCDGRWYAGNLTKRFFFFFYSIFYKPPLRTKQKLYLCIFFLPTACI